MDYASGISDALRKRVEKASPSGLRCLIENCPNDRAVQFCHVAPKSHLEKCNKIDGLERCWNLRKYSLNLDSRYNIMCVGASLYRLYEQHCWALLPDTDIIEQYYNSLDSKSGFFRAEPTAFPDIPNGIFSYRLLPLRNMKSFGITRQHDTGPPTVGSFDHHVYPFDQLPLLRSHVHPRFVILELGRKLHAVHKIMAAYEGSQLEATFVKVFLLYLMTTRIALMAAYRNQLAKIDLIQRSIIERQIRSGPDPGPLHAASPSVAVQPSAGSRRILWLIIKSDLVQEVGQ